MADNPGGSTGLSQATANQILQALARISQVLGNTGLPGSTSTTAGSASGLYLNVTANGNAYKIALLNP